MAYVTLEEIARLAGVSRGTVDRVIHNRGGVNPAVASRIREIAAEMGYKPNPIGRALANAKNPITIGIIINGVGNPFFDDVLAGVQAARDELAGFGLEILVKSSKGYDPKKQLRFFDEVAEAGVAGIGAAPLNNREIALKINHLKEKSIPTVVFNSDIEGAEKLAFVGCNYSQSGKTAASLMGKFLRGRGKVLLAYGSSQMMGHVQRVEGFRTYMEERYKEIRITGMIECFDDDDKTRELIGKAMKKEVPDGVFFAAGGVQGGLEGIQAGAGKGVCVITCDETDYIQTRLLDGGIAATIGQEPFQQGYLPVKLLFDFIFNKTAPEKEVYFTKNEIKIAENL